MKSGVLLGAAISGLCAVLCSLPGDIFSAYAKAPDAQKQITFPPGPALGSVNIEREVDTPPYLLTVKPAFARASGTISYPQGARLQVAISYDFSQNPTSLPALNHPDIVSLQCTGMPIDDTFVAKLKGFKYLHKIRLDETEITDGCLKDLASLPNLQEIDLSKTLVTGKGLKDLAGLKNLTVLYLHHTDLSPHYLIQLAALTRLRVLELANCGLDDRSMPFLAPLTNLLQLSLSTNPHITDRGLAKLKPLANLRALDLWDTAVSARGLEQLTCKGLKNLHIQNVGVKPEEKASLGKTFPHCSIKNRSGESKIPTEVFGPLH